jgi:hypothetical protein
MRARFPLALTAVIFALTLFAAASSPHVTPLGQFTGTDSPFLFGDAVVISQDGSTAAVGGPYGNGTSGEIYVYEKPVAGWTGMTQTARLHPTSQCLLGGPLAISADGSTIASFAGACSGGGYLGYSWMEVFVRPADGWQDTATPTAILSLPGAVQYNYLGLYMGMSEDGETIVATGYFPGVHRSILFLFNKPAGGWANMATSSSRYLLSDHATEPEAVAINGRTVAVTNHGDLKIHVFHRYSKGLVEVAVLSSSDGAGLCCSLEVSAEAVVAEGFDSSSNAGKAYLFAKPSTGWASATETAQFSAPNLGSFANFGSAISISGKNLLIGGFYTSAAYLYIEPSGGWQTTSQPDVTLVSTDSNQTNFGDFVAIVGATLVVADARAGINGTGDTIGEAFVYALHY